MAKSLFEYLEECGSLTRFTCKNCTNIEELYEDPDGGAVCKECLMAEEHEEPEHGFTIRERNE